MKDYTIFEDVRYINNLLTRRSVEKNFLTPTETLTRANTLIIKYLVNNSGKDIFQKDVENKFGITKSTASTVLKHMEEKGFIKRKSINKDARYKKLIPKKSRRNSCSNRKGFACRPTFIALQFYLWRIGFF